MKCQLCEKPATFHITELADEELREELHLCEEHAREYLTDPHDSDTSIAGALSQHIKVSQTAEELARLDRQECPVCGITFYEFRNQGRMGCPHDYVCFADELEPLLANIHGETAHQGKRPKRAGHGTDRQTELIRLRREMKMAVEQEDYELASDLRDRIRAIEQSVSGELHEPKD
jgi:protein arginine kinase activator